MPLISTPPDKGSIKERLTWVVDVSQPGTTDFKTAARYLYLMMGDGKMPDGYKVPADDLYRRVRDIWWHENLEAAKRAVKYAPELFLTQCHNEDDEPVDQPKLALVPDSGTDDDMLPCEILSFPEPKEE